MVREPHWPRPLFPFSRHIGLVSTGDGDDDDHSVAEWDI
jgi:hypothetical protein